MIPLFRSIPFSPWAQLPRVAGMQMQCAMPAPHYPLWLWGLSALSISTHCEYLTDSAMWKLQVIIMPYHLCHNMPSLRSTYHRDTGAIFFCITSPNNRQSDPINREILNSVKVERRNFVMSLPNNNPSPPRSNPDNLPKTRRFEIQLGTVQIGCVYIEMANLPRHIWSRGWPSHPVGA